MDNKYNRYSVFQSMVEDFNTSTKIEKESTEDRGNFISCNFSNNLSNPSLYLQYKYSKYKSLQLNNSKSTSLQVNNESIVEKINKIATLPQSEQIQAVKEMQNHQMQSLNQNMQFQINKIQIETKNRLQRMNTEHQDQKNLEWQNTTQDSNINHRLYYFRERTGISNFLKDKTHDNPNKSLCTKCRNINI